MYVNFELRRRAETGEAEGWLLEGAEARRVLEVCARMGVDPLERVFPVSGGVLVRLEEPSREPVPEGIRLRTLEGSPNLLLPVDAELSPALLEDEAEGLGRRRGLIVLWGGRVLEYDPSSPVPLRALLTVERRGDRTWRALPSPPRVAETIEGWVIEPSARRGAEDEAEAEADEVLDPGGEGIGAEPPRAESPGRPEGLGGKARQAAGRVMEGLGRTLGLSGLQALGRSWIGAGANLEALPAPGASLEWRQKEALRALVKEFREGDMERALRHALPFQEERVGPVPRSTVGDQLPDQSATYSLTTLLGPSERGPVGTWIGGQDVLADLLEEYRRAARKAQEQGDYRRAAYIYGRLLRDYAAAARVLLAGGLYRDAAVLYLAKLDNPRAAARAFEAACEFERALELYRRERDFEAAGDLLRKLGRREEAVREYRQAAQELVARNRGSVATGQLAAGKLMLAKAARADLALEHFLEGWRARERAGSLSSGLEAAQLLARMGRAEELLTLVEDAEAWFGAKRESADRLARWYNALARLGRGSAMKSISQALLDRARMGLARGLDREVQPGSRPGAAVAAWFSPLGGWSASVLRDAEFAARARAGREARPGRARNRAADELEVETGQGKVVACAFAEGGGTVFLGFVSGCVLALDTATLEISPVTEAGGKTAWPVGSISTDAEGKSVAVLSVWRGGRGLLSTFERRADGRYRALLDSPVDGLANAWLSANVAEEGRRFGIWDGVAIHVDAIGEAPISERLEPPRGEERMTGGLILGKEASQARDKGSVVLVNRGYEWFLLGSGREPDESRLTWRAAEQAPETLQHPVLSFVRSSSEVQVVAISEHGSVGWGAFRVGPGLEVVGSASRPCRVVDVYRAACLVRAGWVVGVSRAEVELLRATRGGLVLERSVSQRMSDVVAVGPDATGAGVCLVGGEGRVRWVALPS